MNNGNQKESRKTHCQLLTYGGGVMRLKKKVILTMKEKKIGDLFMMKIYLNH